MSADAHARHRRHEVASNENFVDQNNNASGSISEVFLPIFSEPRIGGSATLNGGDPVVSDCDVVGCTESFTCLIFLLV